MMKTILKCLAVVGLLAHGAFAAGTWELVTNSWYDSTKSPRGHLYDCGVDTKGVIWYLILDADVQGIYSYTPSTKVTAKHVSSFKGLIQGMYLNPATDSLYVGVDTGRVYSGINGVFHELPKIPLLYYYNDGFSNTMMSRVYDLIHDSKGRLIAATDSLAWWLDGATWKPIGKYDQYGEGELDGRIYNLQMDKDGMIFGGGGQIGYKVSRITPSLQVLKSPVTPSIEGLGMTIGPSGTVYTADGDRNWVMVYRPEKNYEPDTMYLYYDNDKNPFNGRQFAALYEDPSGALWTAQDDWLKIYYKDTVKVFWDVPFLQSVMSRAVRFVLDRDSNFYLCSQDAILKYSEKYRVPEEVFSGSPIVPQVARLLGLNAQETFGGLLLRSAIGASSFRILDLMGRPVWSGIVDGETFVPISSGTWIIQGIQKTSKEKYTRILSIRNH